MIVDRGEEMEIPAFASAIPDGVLDFILFEACYMACVEVVYELKDKTDYNLASAAEIVSPGFDPVYKEIVPLLFEEAADLKGFCEKVKTDYSRCKGDYGSLMLSLIRMAGLGALAAVVKKYYIYMPVRSVSSIGSKKNEIVPVDGASTVQTFDRGEGSLFFDCGDYFSLLMPENEKTTLQLSFGDCVVWKIATALFMPGSGGFEIKAHSGLTVYIPQEKYPHLNKT